jgi:hypothetical protein
MVYQVIQLAGAVLILSAFAAQQFKRLDAETKLYQLLNAAGAAMLTISALEERQWGFILLEGTWTVLSVAGLIRVMRKQEPVSS